MNKFSLLCFFLILSISVFSQGKYNEPSNAFKVGEELVYAAKYGIIKGGEAKIKLGIIENGSDFLYHAIATAETTGTADVLFTVRDVYESKFNMFTGLPIMSVRNVHESNYKRYQENKFDHANKRLFNANNEWIAASDSVMDVISAFYFARSFLFKNRIENKEITMEARLSEKPLFFGIKYKGIEKVKTNFGKVECLHYVALVKNDDKFVQEDDISIYFTNDKNYIPLKIYVNLPVGSIRLNLIGYSGVKNPLQIENSDGKMTSIRAVDSKSGGFFNWLFGKKKKKADD